MPAKHFHFCQCRNGLDYVVSQAALYNIKLILTLTNYFVSPTYCTPAVP